MATEVLLTVFSLNNMQKLRGKKKRRTKVATKQLNTESKLQVFNLLTFGQYKFGHESNINA